MNNSPERQPLAEAPLPQGGYEVGSEQAKEAPSVVTEGVGKKQPKQALPAAPQSVTIPIQQPDPAAQTDGQTQAGGAAAIGKPPADDVDLIEKHWVEKAKEIVDKTHDDPFKQKSEMSKVKATYIKERFNKAIPTDDAVRT